VLLGCPRFVTTSAGPPHVGRPAAVAAALRRSPGGAGPAGVALMLSDRHRIGGSAIS
jgi:hypothetical protein